MHITFIQTGGTIDKDYPRGETHHGYDFTITRPAVASILPACHALFTYDIVEATKKDSLDLTEQDRRKIIRAIKSAASSRIVITHGSDTILETAETLNGKVDKDKSIVLTAAMLPEKFVNSDAKFNIGMAVAAVQTLQPGIYIALYGQVVPWQDFHALSQEFEQRSKAIPTQGKDFQ